MENPQCGWREGSGRGGGQTMKLNWKFGLVVKGLGPRTWHCGDLSGSNMIRWVSAGGGLFGIPWLGDPAVEQFSCPTTNNTGLNQVVKEGT
jgi:hypothetical protein